MYVHVCTVMCWMQSDVYVSVCVCVCTVTLLDQSQITEQCRSHIINFQLWCYQCVYLF